LPPVAIAVVAVVGVGLIRKKIMLVYKYYDEDEVAVVWTRKKIGMSIPFFLL